jgi:hypothetical protein
MVPEEVNTGTANVKVSDRPAPRLAKVIDVPSEAGQLMAGVQVTLLTLPAVPSLLAAKVIATLFAAPGPGFETMAV